MRTLAVMSRKGGSGKTTVSINLTLAARACGLRAVLADADPMRGAGEVLRRHAQAGSMLIETSAAKLFPLTQACRRAGVDLLVVDTPAAPEAEVAEAIKFADLCLAVARPSPIDLLAAAKSLEVVRRLGLDGLVLLNQCPPPRKGAEPPAVKRAVAAMQTAGLPLARAVLRDRQAYQTSLAQARSVVEAAADGAAARETQALFDEVWGAVAAPLARPRAASL